MGRLRVKAMECKYKEWDRRLKEQFINSMNDKTLTADIRKELTIINYISKVMRKEVLSWVTRIEIQQSQKAMLETLNDKTDFNMIKKSKYRIEH